MEARLANADGPAVSLEALEQLRPVQRPACVRVREDELVVGPIGGLPVEIV
jgi:hypothetical protein